jgi:nitrogen fixation protein FixH
VNERRARRFWLAFIVFFFVAQAGLWTWAIATVSRDASHAIVASYDARALDWDRQRAGQQASDALGWETAIELDGAAVTVRILDRDRRPLAGADVTCTLFHKAEAARRQSPALRETEPGVFRGTVDPLHVGSVVVELAATREGDRFATTKTLTVE